MSAFTVIESLAMRPEMTVTFRGVTLSADSVLQSDAALSATIAESRVSARVRFAIAERDALRSAARAALNARPYWRITADGESAADGAEQ